MYLLELKESNHALAVAEARAVGELVKEHRGVAVVLEPDLTRYLGMSHAVSSLVCESSAEVGAVVDAVSESGYVPDGDFAVRARVHGDGVSSTEVERRVGAALVGRGAAVELDTPDTVVRVVVSEGRAYVGELICETAGFGGRAPTEKPFFKPGSMSPVLARALSNIAGGYGGARLLDPTCGTGGVLVESALAGGRVYGVDASREMVEGARTNLREYVEGDSSGTWEVAVGDARTLPFGDSSFDAAVTDLPYGRASHVEGNSADSLARGVLTELARVARPDGRVVAVSDRWLDDAARDAGFGIVDRIEDRVHRSLTRRIVVLSNAEPR